MEAGETLAMVDSTELGNATTDYLQAAVLVGIREKTDAREKRLMESKVTTEEEVLKSEAKLAESRIMLARAARRLQNLGFSKEQVQNLTSAQDASSLLPLRALFPGVVVERTAVIGEVVNSQTPLFAIADTDTMWAMLDLYESDIPIIQNGQSVVFESAGLPGEQFGGQVSWISAHVDSRTRTLKVRAELANTDGLLRAGMFGRALISIRTNEAALVIPKEAVQWEGCCNIVFVKHSEVLFEPRKVKLGYEGERFFVVDSGLSAGEEIVTTGSFLLKTEILKGNIGAGCCEVEHGQE